MYKNTHTRTHTYARFLELRQLMTIWLTPNTAYTRSHTHTHTHMITLLLYYYHQSLFFLSVRIFWNPKRKSFKNVKHPLQSIWIYYIVFEWKILYNIYTYHYMYDHVIYTFYRFRVDWMWQTAEDRVLETLRNTILIQKLRQRRLLLFTSTLYYILIHNDVRAILLMRFAPGV